MDKIEVLSQNCGTPITTGVDYKVLLEKVVELVGQTQGVIVSHETVAPRNLRDVAFTLIELKEILRIERELE